MLSGLGLAGAAVGVGWMMGEPSRPHPSWQRRLLSVAQWRETRGAHYYLGHRGSGDVRPEHTVVAYDAALGWGAKALEISTSSTSDGVLICLHDLTYDRTTTGTGTVNDQPSSVLDRIRVRQPQLGPRWTTPPLPRIPLFEDVLRRYGHHAVLCVEAKRDADYPAMIAMVERYGLQDSIIVKAYYASDVISVAKRAGYPVFAYVDAGDFASTSRVADVAASLDPAVDYLGLPTTRDPGDTVLEPALVRAAVAGGVPVWVYPVHRRSEADYFTGLGVAGVMASSYHYLTTNTARTAVDTWRAGAVASGEMSKNPSSAAFAPHWDGNGALTLAVPGQQQFLTLGQFAPLPHARSSYQIDVEACWDVLPSDRQAHVDLVFAHLDDTYYEDGSAGTSGYHAVVRADGSLQVFAHDAGPTQARPLSSTATTPPPAAGRWMRLRLQVTPSRITWTRRDIESPVGVTVSDSTWRGGYLHIGRTNTDQNASASFRNLRAS